MSSDERAVAIVVAGAGDAGAATARTLVHQGARVVVADVQDDRGRALAAALGPACNHVHADASHAPDMHRLVAGTVERHGRIDCLFNYTRVPGPPLGISELTPEAWDAMLAVLLRGAYLGMHFAGGWMRRQGGGSIVSSVALAGVRAGSGSHAAAAAGAALVHLTRSVALEFAATGVRVNCICPLPHLDAADVARAAVWLCSEAARGMNGRTLLLRGPREATSRAPPSACWSRRGPPSARHR